MRKHFRISLGCFKGFTLTELVIACSITIFFMAAFISAFIGMRNGMYAQDSLFSSNRSAYFAMNQLSKDTREAITIVNTYSGNTTANAVLILALPSVNASNVPIDTTLASSTYYDYVVYKLSGTDLVRSVTLGTSSQRNGASSVSNRKVAANVTTFSLTNSSGTGFTSLSAAAQAALKIFKVSITSGETIGGQTRSITANEDMMLYNK